MVAYAALVPSRLGLPPDAWQVALLLPVLALTGVAIVDRAGWRIRSALAELGTLSNGRTADVPIREKEAETWLASDAGKTAPSLDRAAAALAAGAIEVARSALDDLQTPTDVERARAALLRAFVDAETTGDLDLRKARDLANGLEADERRYRLLAIAWAAAVDDMEHRRPWRSRFLDESSGLAPFRVTRRVWFAIAITQLGIAITLALVTIPFVLVLAATL